MSSKVNCKNNVIQKYKVIYLYVSKRFHKSSFNPQYPPFKKVPIYPTQIFLTWRFLLLVCRHRF